MDSTQIFWLQLLTSVVVFGIVAVWYIWPSLTKLSRNSALIPLLFAHVPRYVGMTLLVAGMVDPKLPREFRSSAAYGDLLEAALALASIFALRSNWRVAVPLVWVANTWGFVDLLNGVRGVLQLNVPSFDLATFWYVYTFYAPLVIVSHFMIFWILINPKSWNNQYNRGQRIMNNQIQIEDDDFPTSRSDDSSKPTIVLVHGALEDSSLWTHGVIQGLQRDGYPVKIFSNPLLGVAVDAAYLSSVLDKIEGAVILVSHAYGGAVITQAGDNPKVKALIYAGSPMPGVGESTNDCLERFPGGDFASSVELTPYTLPDGTSGTNVHVKAEKYRYLVAADVPKSVVDLMIATQRPISFAALNEPLTSAAWTSKPSWQLRPLLDPLITVEEFKFEADRAHSHVIELNSSQAVPITFPDVVVDVIKQAARATTK